MQFSVGNDHISFPDEIEYYNVIWSRLCRSRNEYIDLFIKNCDNLGSAQNLVSSGNELGLKYLDSVFVSFDDIFIKTGMYDFNARYLRQHYLYSHIIKEYCDTIEEIKNALDVINQKRNSVYRARDISKNTRPRVVGGGFGVANAVKGILIAESINLAVGAIHGGFNFIANCITDLRVSESKEELFQNSKVKLVQALRNAMNNLILVLMDLCKCSINLDRSKSEFIIQNINNNRIGIETLRDALLEAIQADPYNETAYKYFIYFFNDDEDDMVGIANFFNIELTPFLNCLHSVLGFYFKDISLVDVAKKEVERCALSNEFFRKEYWEPQYKWDLLECVLIIFETQFLVFNTEPELVNFRYYCLQKFYEACPTNALKKIKAINQTLLSKDEIIKDISNTHRYDDYGSAVISWGDQTNVDLQAQMVSRFFPSAKSGKVYFVAVDKKAFQKGIMLCSEGIVICTMELYCLLVKFIDSSSAVVIPFESIADISHYDEHDILIRRTNGGCEFLISSGINNVRLASLLNEFYPYVAPEQAYKNGERLITLSDASKCFLSGLELEKKGDQACINLYVKGVLKEDSWCSYQLGILYSRGIFVGKNYEKAKYWFKRAYEGNNEYAVEYLNKYKNILSSVADISHQEAFCGNEFYNDGFKETLIKFIQGKYICYKPTVKDDGLEAFARTLFTI